MNLVKLDENLLIDVSKIESVEKFKVPQDFVCIKFENGTEKKIYKNTDYVFDTINKHGKTKKDKFWILILILIALFLLFF